MQKLTKTLSTLALLGLAATGAHAQVVSYYDFGTTATGAAPTTFAPTSGNGTLTVVGFTSGAAATNNVVFFGGSTVNAQPGSVAGAALAVLGGTAAGGNNGGYIQFATSTVGLTGVYVSYATQGTGTGFNSDVLSYSTDGGTTFTTFGSPYAPPTAFAQQVFNLSSVALLNNNPLAAFRITFNGATSAAGNNRIDNLTVSSAPAAAPEPSSLVAMFLGAGALGLMATRRRRTMNAA